MIMGFNLLIGVVLLATVIFLQVFLSKRDIRWPGLILPIICFAYALVSLSNIIRTA